MLNGLADDEIESFLDEHPTIIPLFKVDVLRTVEPYLVKINMAEQEAPHDPNLALIEELRHARDLLEHELTISHRVKASTLEDINLGSSTKPRTLKITKALTSKEHQS
mgnify:CR=1 FL=1